MRVNNKTGPLPIIRDMDELLRKAKQAFLDTQKEMARVARERIDGDATQRKANEKDTKRQSA